MSSIFISTGGRERRATPGGSKGTSATTSAGEGVFRDIDSTRPGSDFAQVIEEAVSRSEVVLALIDVRWLTAADVGGHRRLEDPDD